MTGSTCAAPVARCFTARHSRPGPPVAPRSPAALQACPCPHSRPGPTMVFIPLARCFAGFPLQHARPAGSTGGFYPGRPLLLRRPIPGPHAPLTSTHPTCGTPVARCFIGLTPAPTPGPVGLDPRFHILRISMKCIYGENYFNFFIFYTVYTVSDCSPYLPFTVVSFLPIGLGL